MYGTITFLFACSLATQSDFRPAPPIVFNDARVSERPIADVTIKSVRCPSHALKVELNKGRVQSIVLDGASKDNIAALVNEKVGSLSVSSVEVICNGAGPIAIFRDAGGAQIQQLLIK